MRKYSKGKIPRDLLYKAYRPQHTSDLFGSWMISSDSKKEGPSSLLSSGILGGIDILFRYFLDRRHETNFVSALRLILLPGAIPSMLRSGYREQVCVFVQNRLVRVVLNIPTNPSKTSIESCSKGQRSKRSVCFDYYGGSTIAKALKKANFTRGDIGCLPFLSFRYGNASQDGRRKFR